MLVGRLDICLQKIETTSMSFTLYKYQFRVDKDLNIRPQTLILVHEKAVNTLEAIDKGNDFVN
jgi:hypothetical protein